MTIDQLLDEGAPPVIAILRGISPREAVEIGTVLIGAGIRMIEVPLNSPEPFASITALQEAFGDCALVGAGTVLDGSSVDRLAATGADLLVAPNTDAQVVARGIGHGLEVLPGFLTPSEAFAAIEAGARKLKLFPASAVGPAYLSAIREVLPAKVAVWAVGSHTTVPSPLAGEPVGGISCSPVRVALKTVVIGVFPALIAPVQHGPKDGGAEERLRARPWWRRMFGAG